MPNMHFTLMSRDCTIFKNYFSTINLMRTVIDGDRRPLPPSSEYYSIKLDGDNMSSIGTPCLLCNS